MILRAGCVKRKPHTACARVAVFPVRQTPFERVGESPKGGTPVGRAVVSVSERSAGTRIGLAGADYGEACRKVLRRRSRRKPQSPQRTFRAQRG